MEAAATSPVHPPSPTKSYFKVDRAGAGPGAGAGDPLGEDPLGEDPLGGDPLLWVTKYMPTAKMIKNKIPITPMIIGLGIYYSLGFFTIQTREYGSGTKYDVVETPGVGALGIFSCAI